jgi:hypothetical protein
LVENYLPRGVSAVKLYIQLMLWTGRRDKCRCEETLTASKRDKDAGVKSRDETDVRTCGMLGSE